MEKRRYRRVFEIGKGTRRRIEGDPGIFGVGKRIIGKIEALWGNFRVEKNKQGNEGLGGCSKLEREHVGRLKGIQAYLVVEKRIIGKIEIL